MPLAVHTTSTPRGAAYLMFDWPREGRASGEMIWLRAIVPHTIAAVGYDCFIWASDYLIPDQPHTWVDDLVTYAENLHDGTLYKVIGGNVNRVYLRG
ncbi:MAG: hypothetical protein VX745_12090 [Pseudomonadota bacterium]|nr:hypothetical protein [Pseudomonadota bacterium]